MNGVLLGLAFLTRLPVRPADPAPGEWGAAARAFPVAGAVVAAGAIAALSVGSLLWTPLVGAALAVVTEAWLTGALHLDGFADCLDGLHCHGDAKRRLEVMHDPRAGAVGAAGTALLVALKVALVAASVDAGTGVAAVWTACVLARAFLPAELAFGRPATPGKGLFGLLAPEVRTGDVATAAVVAAAVVAPAVVLVPALAPGLAVGVVLAGVATVAWHRAWGARIGGVNGDVLGAGVELREVILLLATTARWPG